MNLKQVNELRAKMGLAPVMAQKAKGNQAANQAARAQACRDLKAKRGNGKKAK
jgi:hypothetical protein